VQDGVLYFCDRYGRRAPVSSTVLGPYLRDHDPLRLVFLNACQSARVDSSDPFSGMAQGLVQQDCVALVAMQFPSATALRPSSPATSTARWPTASPSTRR
jgi:hypothetical protein